MKKIKKVIKGIIPKPISAYISKRNELTILKKMVKQWIKRFMLYGFGGGLNTEGFIQLEAQIIKAYHSIEKGLAHTEIRLPFGKTAANNLSQLLIKYNLKLYSKKEFCYTTAISVLKQYFKVHDDANVNIDDIKIKFKELDLSTESNLGGTDIYNKDAIYSSIKKDFKVFSNSRRSVREFSDKKVDTDDIMAAIDLARNTPSACNRQGWIVRLIEDKTKMDIISDNQNGNTSFGDKLDKYLVITSNLEAFARPRERFQPFIDGGMYAMNLLYSLHYYGIATVPLSASLSLIQEKTIRNKLDIGDSEYIIMFIGLGNYADTFKVPKSSRKQANVKIL
ncbi:nitroreductase family protein [Mariniplasma anaerobium]|uniref:Nitroreductase domain-containing protein n=1 Tax=Mariniplasma anaerobium TaxID=2735436 RepID=A0A7U9TI07_9MOLU|nr:nitroreductase family protein [Mariniplasma anaerobium]BCR36089.1 hypothetical protein MPAN_009820 [Mariniplasma anaerobium]